MNPKTKNEESGITSEIDEMMKAFGQPVLEPSKDPVEEEISEEEEPIEEPESEEADDEEKPEKDEDEESEKEETPTEEPAEKLDDEPDEKDKVIADLREKLTEKETPVPKEDEKEDEKPTIEELTFEAQDFVGEEDVEDLVHDKESLNKLLNTIYQKAISDSRGIVGEHVLKDIPDIVRTNLTLISELAEARKEFYKDNPDLEVFPGVVAAVYEEMLAANPDKGYKDIINEVGKEARSRLNLHKKATDAKPDKKEERVPKLPGKKGTRTSKDQPDISGVEGEIDEMNKIVRR